MRAARAVQRYRRVAYPVTGVVTIIIVWYLIVWTGLVSKNTLPGPWLVARRIPELLGSSEFDSNLLDTLESWLIALAISIAVGVTIALVTSSIPFLRAPTELVVDTFRAIPSTALIPIGIVMFGIGTSMKVSIAVYAGLWFVMINTAYGVLGTDSMRIDASRSMRWSWLRRLAYVTLPSALPNIATGIRIASGTVLVVVVSTELLGAEAGVGTLLARYQRAFRPDLLLAGTVVIGVIGAVLYGLLGWMEQRLIKWNGHV